MSRRTDEDVLAGVIRVPMPGGDRLMPTLKIKAAREWKSNAMEAAQGLFKFDGAIESLPDIAALASDTMIDLIVAYDADSVLGGKEALEDSLDDAQAWAVLKSLLEVAFPFAQDLATMIRALGLDLATPMQAALSGPVRSVEPSNTNGRSQTGRGSRTPKASSVG